MTTYRTTIAKNLGKARQWRSYRDPLNSDFFFISFYSYRNRVDLFWEISKRGQEPLGTVDNFIRYLYWDLSSFYKRRWGHFLSNFNPRKDTQLQQIVDKTIIYADQDGDGKISYDEFCAVSSSSKHFRIRKFFFIIYFLIGDFRSE